MLMALPAVCPARRLGACAAIGPRPTLCVLFVCFFGRPRVALSSRRGIPARHLAASPLAGHEAPLMRHPNFGGARRLSRGRPLCSCLHSARAAPRHCAAARQRRRASPHAGFCSVSRTGRRAARFARQRTSGRATPIGPFVEEVPHFDYRPKPHAHALRAADLRGGPITNTPPQRGVCSSRLKSGASPGLAHRPSVHLTGRT